MKHVSYTDPQGRHFDRLLPDYAADTDAFKGVPNGPPPLDSLGLPAELEIRLHNALFNRGLFTLRDIEQRPNEVAAAIMSALKLDAAAIMALYS